MHDDDLFDRVRRRYSLDDPTLTAIERAVIGADYGANGYTTAAQADELGGLLGLTVGHRLLDVGAGRGWPGLRIGAALGCAVVATDVPLEGLVAGRARAREDGNVRCEFAAARGEALPFRPASFDGIVHTDVLC